MCPGGTNFMSAGVGNHLYSWGFAKGGNMTPKRVTLPKLKDGAGNAITKKVIFSTIKHSKDGRAWISCSSGHILEVKGSATAHDKIHDKAVYCVNVIEHEGKEILLSGSADHTIKLHSIQGALQLLKTLNVGANAIPRSLDMMTNAKVGTKILAGLNNGCI